MSLLKGWKLTLLAGVTLAGTGGQVLAQKPGSLGPDMLGPSGSRAIPVSYAMDDGVMPGAVAPGMDAGAYAQPMGYPEGYGPEGMDPSLMGGPPPCPECGGPCAGCGGSHADGFGRDAFGLLSSIRARLASMPFTIMPYGEGGIATQRWFDASFEGIGLARTVGADSFNVSSIGINGPRVLGSDNVPINDMNAGFQTQLNILCGPGSNVEVLYFGMDDWNQTATVTRPAPGDLYSFLSNFGQTPAGGFDDCDQSISHSLSYQSELHNGEISFRRRWAEPYGFFQGSFLTGVRYLDLDERSIFSAVGLPDDFLDYTVNTTNTLVGWQVGGDLWYNIMPGVKAGCELKTGIYNNRSEQRTSIVSSSLPGFGIPEIRETVGGNTHAFVTQLSPQLVYRITYSIAIKTSYQVIWVDNVALAVNNFNSVPPSLFLPGSGRVASLSNKSDIVYNGLTLGAELTW